MKTRIKLPTPKELHKLFVYKNGHLYWKDDAQYGQMKSGDRAGYKATDGYWRICVHGKLYMAHRLIWRMHNHRGPMPFVLDHIDGDRSNNQIKNLRAITASENQHNRHKRDAPRMRAENKLHKFL
jgi:hypothetical protein